MTARRWQCVHVSWALGARGRRVETVLGWLLRDRDARIPVSDTPAAISARLEQLRGEGILELEHGARASEIERCSSSSRR